MITRAGSCSSRHQVTSVRSPKVQHITMPAPLSGSAASWASTGSSTPNSGVRTVWPNSGVALVVGVGDQRHAGRDQLGPGGLDVDRPAVGRGKATWW